MVALIMAGGLGTRFWPLSRRTRPKQFLNIMSDRSMIQITADRLLKVISPEKLYVITPQSQKSLVQEHLSFLTEDNIIIEPFGMNTAPCIALASTYLKSRYGEEENVLVMPADHVIQKESAFFKSLDIAADLAAAGTLVTFGIKPDYPATGYGYIEAGEKINHHSFKISNFKEKPDLKTAAGFLKSGKYFWNSGMFFWKISAILSAFEMYLPEVTDILLKIEKKWSTKGLAADISSDYENMPRTPIDIGIMEKSADSAVIPVDLGWNDIGSWKALYEISKKDENGNVLPAENIILDSRGNYIYSDKMIALVGVENLTVVETDDVILIADRASSQEVKKVVDKLAKENKEDYL